MQQRSATYHLTVHACHQPLLARGLSIDSRTAYPRYGQSECHIQPAPIRTPERLSRTGGQRRILGPQPRVTPEHERQPETPFKSLYFSNKFSHLFGQMWPGVIRRTNRNLTNLVVNDQSYKRVFVVCLRIKDSGGWGCTPFISVALLEILYFLKISMEEGLRADTFTVSPVRVSDFAETHPSQCES